MIISMIAAIGEENRVLGKDNKLLWSIPEDMKFFREMTRGHPVIMGRKTFESMGKPLPNRTNIVVTRDEKFKAEGVVVANSIEQALVIARSEATKQSSVSSGIASDPASSRNDEEIFIIGGGQIYTQGIKLADRLYLTIVQGNYEGDAFFPDYSEFAKVISQRESEGNGYKYTFLTLEK